MNRFFVKAALTVAVVAILTGTGFALNAWSRSRLGSIASIEVRKGTFVDYLQVRGEIRPVKSIVMTAPSSGADMQIVQLAANGASVSPGEVVVQFDSTTQQRALEQRRSELKQAESEVGKVEGEGVRRLQAAEAELAQARSAASRARLDAARAELVAKVEAEKLTLLLANAEQHAKALEQKVKGERQTIAADLNIARQKRDKARYDVAETERIIGALTLRAPAAGTLSILPNFRASGPFTRSAPEFRRGDRVWFGAPIAELPDLSAVQMTCRLDEADRARVQTGTNVLVKIDAVPDRELKASIHDIAVMSRPDFSSWPPVRNFDVIVRLQETDERLRTGMSASARIELNRLTDVIVVPATAIFQREGEFVAYVVRGGAAEVRPVTILRRGRDEIAIASGLEPGDRIALQDPTAAGDR